MTVRVFLTIHRAVATVFSTPSGKNTKTQIKPSEYRLLGRVPQNHRHTLNRRLVGAPYVADYVCIHELCHCPHSPAFWELTRRFAPTRPKQNSGSKSTAGAFRLADAAVTLSDGIRAGTGTRPPDSNRDDALPPVRGRMAASAPSAPFHFTPPSETRPIRRAV
ncbi:M48 family metallopeptidase [Neisseria gonorrhoeae]|uniref:M48 metallopeptidase family protein n=1 Tax=Neisseria gonorrhoeae TaxID=485 RepID=UPI001E42BFA6|nr:M48 family metallopeptidase [Neisseria gonorrhoeae]MCC9119304.1 M48 family metallopeptidase [Neisseria gonorrhoeae]